MAERAKKRKDMDMVNGKIFGKIILFSLPLMLSGALQLLFNAADVAVIGQFSGTNSLAAVSSTGSLVHLITNVFIGLSVGANVIMSRAIGAADPEKAGRTLHTAILLSLISGVAVALIGVFGARTFLTVMNVKADVLDKATLYLQIYFAGSPFPMLYNFGASLLRAKGDTKRPLIFLSIAGVVNIVLNLFFVIVCKMDVAGVAIATIASQAVSAVLVMVCLIREHGYCKLSFKRLRIYGKELKEILYVGLPAGIYSSLFSLSNVIIQSNINGFYGDEALDAQLMAGNSTSTNIENFVYIIMNALYNAAITFTGQNVGAKKYKRIKLITLQCFLMVCVVGIVLGGLVLLCSRPLSSIFTKDPAVIDIAVNRMRIILPTYFTCGVMEIFSGVLRGMGYSIQPMFISFTGACLLRVVWLYTVFKRWHTMTVLFMCYPVSWIITSLALFILLVIAYNRIKKKAPPEPMPLPEPAPEPQAPEAE